MADFVRLPDVAMVALRMRNDASHQLPAVGKSLMLGPDTAVAIGPDEWLIIAPDADAAALSKHATIFGGVPVDVSGNRIRYRIQGKDARWLLAAGISLDIDHLATGDAVSTLFARAQVILVVEGEDRFLVLPRRSFGRYLEDWVSAVND